MPFLLSYILKAHQQNHHSYVTKPTTTTLSLLLGRQQQQQQPREQQQQKQQYRLFQSPTEYQNWRKEIIQSAWKPSSSSPSSSTTASSPGTTTVKLEILDLPTAAPFLQSVSPMADQLILEGVVSDVAAAVADRGDDKAHVAKAQVATHRTKTTSALDHVTALSSL